MEYESIKYEAKDKSLYIRFSKEENTIWMNQSEIAILYVTSLPNISKHLKKIGATFNSELIVAEDGKQRKIKLYNLDVIKQIGYIINPQFTVKFVAWCNEQLNRLNNKIVQIESNYIRFIDGKLSLEVNVSPMEQTVWLTQNSIAELFDTTQQNISQHIANIIDEGELVDDSVHKEFL